MANQDNLAITDKSCPLTGTPLSNDWKLMSDFYPECPECGSSYTYPDGALMVCPECAHEWSPEAAEEEASEGGGAPPASVSDGAEVLDSVGNPLQDGDTVVVTRTLKVKGAPGPLKAGTKVKGIRLVDGDHNIDCKIPGFGGMKLKSEFVKKA